MKNKFKSLAFSSCVVLGLALGGVQQAARATDSDDSILKGFKTIKVLGSTVPANGDVNPYGMAQVKYSVGRLHSGHILVSNFNNSSNAAGHRHDDRRHGARWRANGIRGVACDACPAAVREGSA